MNVCSRSVRFLIGGFALSLLPAFAFGAHVISSPDGNIVATIDSVSNRLSCSVTFHGSTVVEPSPLGLNVNNTNLAVGLLMGGAIGYFTNETFPSRHGIHRHAANCFNGVRITVAHPTSGLFFVLNARVYDTGVAFRYEFTGTGTRNITAEATGFVLPENSIVWSQENVSVYEDAYSGTNIAALATNVVMGPPVVVQLPGTNGLLALTESSLGIFGSPYLRKAAESGSRQLKVEYPLNQGGSTGASASGGISTPWNVIMIASSLDALVNNDIVESLAPPPDPLLFPNGSETAWTASGRSVWDWLRPQPGGITHTNAMTNSLWAARLGFEFNTVDEGWANWNGGNPWPQVQQVVNFSRAHQVKVLLWKRSSELSSSGQRASFFQQLTNHGVSGFKADFFDFNSLNASANERVKLQDDILRDAAAMKLVVNFHGATKPTGQFRTYPNLLQVEAIFGKEQWLSSAAAMPVPFTRFLAGPADFTPMELGGNKAYEIATVINMPGPLITFAERSDTIARSVFAPVIRSIPPMWDETRVLTQSALGETVATARRTGGDWFVGIMNTRVAKTWVLPLTFLESNTVYQAHIIRENSATIERTTVTRNSLISVLISQTGGSGFVGRFFQEPPFGISTDFLLEGTIIGTSGSFGGAGNTRERAFDGSLATYFDAPSASGAWTGLDLGSGNNRIVTTIRYCPRPNWPTRMFNGLFQGASSADFSDAITLHVVGFTPVEGGFTTVAISNTTAFRYLRYLSPPEGSCNVAEIQFYGAAVPGAPTGLSGRGLSDQVHLQWDTAAGVSGYTLKRVVSQGGPFEVIATNVPAAVFVDTNVVRGGTYFYRVAAEALEFRSADSAAAKVVFHDLELAVDWIGTNLLLSWPASGKLLEATNLLGPWVTNQSSSPVEIIPVESQKFFRLLIQ